MKIYYKVITEWCKWPFNNEVDKKYCAFSTSKKNFDKSLLDFTMASNTSIQEKEMFVKQKMNIPKVEILKIK